MKTILKSKKLENVCYDIRGPVLEEAYRMEEAGQRILKLNIGNPAPFRIHGARRDTERRGVQPATSRRVQ
jgi:aspartate/methionine/tyrosine aminotransferase